MTTNPNSARADRPVFTHAEISCLFIALAQMRSFIFSGVERGQFAPETGEVLVKAISSCTIQPIDAHRNMFSAGQWDFSLEGLTVTTTDADKAGRDAEDGK